MARLKGIYTTFQRQARHERSLIFKERFSLKSHHKILDLGGGDGTHLFSILDGTEVKNENVYLADISQDAIARGHRQYGFNPVHIQDRSLEFQDNFFDIVFSNSVIEHVTIDKEDVWKPLQENLFREKAWKNQQRFAEEIRRLGKEYWVQTPNKWFPIESHTFLPLVGFFPRAVSLPIIKLSNRIWIKNTTPDWKLLSKNEMKSLFPEATIIEEKTLGLAKSFIAVKADKGKIT